MAIDFNTVADRVFDQLKGFGHSITIFDENGKQTVNAAEGRYFYSTDQKFTVEINQDESVIKIKYGEGTDPARMQKLQSTIRNGIAKKFILGVDLRPYTGKDIEPKDVENMVKVQESLGPVAGSMKTSYQQTEGAKLIIRHSKPVNEEVRGSRSRNIHALFIENAQGERFRYPHIHLAAARTMTQHVAEGGTPYDEVGQKIISLSEERGQLLQVARYIKSNGLNEQASDVHFAVGQRLGDIKGLLSGRFSAERLAKDVHEADETNLEALQEKLTKNVFDENIGTLLPKLNGYMKSYQAQMEATKAFDSLKQQVEEATSIAVSAIPDLDFSSVIVYESPTVNTTELINLVLPVLEDQTVKAALTAVSEHVAEGRLDPAAVENLTRGIIGKCSRQTAMEDSRYEVGAMFETALRKFSVEEILKS
jgi:hypothetical protein